MKQDASLTLGKTLDKTEKRAKDEMLLTPLYAKKIPPSKNTLVSTTLLKNSLDPEVANIRYFIRNSLFISKTTCDEKLQIRKNCG